MDLISLESNYKLAINKEVKLREKFNKEFKELKSKLYKENPNNPNWTIANDFKKEFEKKLKELENINKEIKKLYKDNYDNILNLKLKNGCEFQKFCQFCSEVQLMKWNDELGWVLESTGVKYKHEC